MTSALLLRDLVRCSRPTSILDIGANAVDGDPPYKEMLDYGLCMVTGFEPQGAQGMTRLLTPDANQLSLFTPFSEWGSVVDEHDVQTHRLDDLDIDDFDLLKIDVQGSELMVFQHGRNRLSNAVAIQTEVSFVERLMQIID